jgi:hypothetical protein
VITELAVASPHKVGRLCGFKELKPIHSRWIKKCWFGRGGGIYALQAARGSYKTSSCLILGTALNLIARPNNHCAVVTKTDSGAFSVLKAIAKLLETEPLQVLYEETHGHKMTFTETTQNRLSIAGKTSPAPEPNIAAFGMGGSITRQHFDDIIIDDVITLEDRTSAAERRRTLLFLQELFGNIAKSGSRIICTGTPWHKYDAWDYIGEVAGGIDKYPVGAAGMEFMDTPEVKAKRSRLTPFLDAINYKLELLKDEGLLFSEPARCELPPEWNPIIHVDAAYGGGDTTAITITDGKTLHGLLREGHVAAYITEINDHARATGAKKGYCEDNGDKGFLRRTLDKDAVERGIGVLWRGYHESQNKILKIQSVLYPAWKRIGVTTASDPKYMEQILYWSPDSAGHDDAPDSAASALRILNRHARKDYNWHIADITELTE